MSGAPAKPTHGPTHPTTGLATHPTTAPSTHAAVSPPDATER